MPRSTCQRPVLKGLLYLMLGVSLLSALPHTAAQAQSSPAASSLTVGSPLGLPEIQDQNGKPWAVTADTRQLIFSSSKAGSSTLQKLLKEAPEGHLASIQAVYLTDMSGMPGFITRNMALPKLQREYAFPIGILLDNTPVKNWPEVEDGITSVELKAGVIQSVKALKGEAEIRAALKL